MRTEGSPIIRPRSLGLCVKWSLLTTYESFKKHRSILLLQIKKEIKWDLHVNFLETSMNLNALKGDKGWTPKGNLGDWQHTMVSIPFLFLFLFADTSIPHYAKYNILRLITFNVVTALSCSTLILNSLTISVRRYARRCDGSLLLSLLFIFLQYLSNTKFKPLSILACITWVLLPLKGTLHNASIPWFDTKRVNKENQKIRTCNWWNLETLGYWPIMDTAPCLVKTTTARNT